MWNIPLEGQFGQTINDIMRVHAHRVVTKITGTKTKDKIITGYAETNAGITHFTWNTETKVVETYNRRVQVYREVTVGPNTWEEIRAMKPICPLCDRIYTRMVDQIEIILPFELYLHAVTMYQEVTEV